MTIEPENHPTMFPLGAKLRCKVTGFTGIATSRIEYLNGCWQYCLKPPVDKDGKDVEGLYIDWQQLEAVNAEPVATGHDRTGGPGDPNSPTSYKG